MTDDFAISKLDRPMLSKAEVKSLCYSNASLLVFDFVDRGKFLHALSGQESGFGERAISRHEPAYDLGGIYFKKSRELQEKYWGRSGDPKSPAYGPMVSMSYGPWQVMYPTALAYGYYGRPLALHDGNVSLPYAIKKLNADFKSGANTLDKILAAYNAGTKWKYPAMWPYRYIQEFKMIFERLV